jgi:pimeloyl-ACP methyl ester carboxylesterase
MKPAQLWLLWLFACRSILAGDFQTSTPPNFPIIGPQTKDLIAKIYSILVPLDSKKKELAPLYPGTLYDVGGYHLHMFCTGTSKKGMPTVMFESGAGGSGTDWIALQLAISRRSRVCTYDRAGYGWSDEWPVLKNIDSVQDVIPRKIDQNVEELERLLTRAEIRAPIVLVGHSYGGPVSLAFEAKYPDRVAGLVLLDPHDDGVSREDRAYRKEISDSLKHLENEKSPEGQLRWAAKLKKMAEHVTPYPHVEIKALIDDLSTLINSTNPMKPLRAVWSEWRAFHSGCAKIKAHPSQSLRNKLLTVISSDPSRNRSEGQGYLHMKIARQSNRGKFYFAMGSSHNIGADRPDLVTQAVNQMLDSLEGKASVKLPEETLPQLKGPTRFFVDGELADFVRNRSKHKMGQGKFKIFCRQLGLGFETNKEFGYFDDRQTDVAGYYVTCD